MCFCSCSQNLVTLWQFPLWYKQPWPCWMNCTLSPGGQFLFPFCCVCCSLSLWSSSVCSVSACLLSHSVITHLLSLLLTGEECTLQELPSIKPVWSIASRTTVSSSQSNAASSPLAVTAVRSRLLPVPGSCIYTDVALHTVDTLYSENCKNPRTLHLLSVYWFADITLKQVEVHCFARGHYRSLMPAVPLLIIYLFPSNGNVFHLQ